jgi:PAS domain-containing protein
MLGSSDKTRRTPPAAPGLDVILRASDGILDILPVATFVCDAAGVILQYNQAAVRIWGRVPEPGQTH